MAFRGALAEELAESLLSRLGYRIVDRRKRVEIAGVDVAEIDIVAEKEGDVYAVEVKAGKVSVTDIRQAFSNAALIGAKALIVCRGFSNEAARLLADKLGVRVLVLDEFLGFVSLDELSRVLERALERSLLTYMLAGLAEAEPEDEKALEALAYSRTPEEAARRLGLGIKELGRVISRLVEKGLIRQAPNYAILRAQAALALDRLRLRRLYDSIASAGSR